VLRPHRCSPCFCAVFSNDYLQSIP
jgi:hypothetical protein